MLVPITWTWDISVGVSVHNYIPTPPGVPPPGTPAPAIELQLPQNWPPGVQLGSVQKTSSVLSNGHAIMQKGHDYGKLIPQLTIPPNNVWLLAASVKASRKCMFSAFSVRMNGKPAGCMAIWPPLPLLACGEPISSPYVISPTNILRDVRVGMTMADAIGGVLGMWLSIGSDAIKSAFEIGDGLGGMGYDAVSGGVVELLSSAAQHAIDPRYPISAQLEFKQGTGILGGGNVTLGVTFGSTDTTNNPSKVTFSTGSNVFANAVSTSSTADYTWDAGANSSAEGVNLGSKSEFRALEYTATSTTQTNSTGTSATRSTNLPYQQTTTTQTNSGPTTTTTVPKDFWGTAL